MGDWEENVFKAKMSSLQREKTPCEQALRIQWTGMVNFPRVDQIPLLGAVTNAIAHSAAKWSSAKNKKSYFDPQDDAMIEMRRLCLERRRKRPL